MTEVEVSVPGSPVREAFLHRPAPPAGGLHRAGLLATLDSGIDLPAALVCAPAGFGKSVLVSQWCEHIEQPNMWLSLDPAIDHPRWFLMHLIAAVRRVFPDALEITSQMAAAEPLPADDALIAELSNELDELDERVVVVLDDYHRVIEPRVHRFVTDLMRHPPAMVHLVIVTREEPPLPIATLRAQGRLAELRMADLAFTPDELDAFMAHELGRPLTKQQIDDLHTSTEGWPAGARLAAHSLRNGDADAVIGAGFLDQAAQEYLVTDVIDNVPAPVRRHLLAVSYFDRFSADLCDAIAELDSATTSTPTMTGAEFIDWIHQHNLFVIQLDEHGDWHRFHHQFARLLTNWRNSTGNPTMSEPDLRRTAATVFSDARMFDEAIEQLHLANAHHELATIAATHGNQLIEHGRWVELARLVSRIPADVLDADPNLLLLKACVVGENESRYVELNDILDRVEHLLDAANDKRPTNRWLRGQVAVLRGVYAKFVRSDFEGAITDAQTARQLLHDSPGRRLTLAYILEVTSLAGAGRSMDAHRLADSLVGDPLFANVPFDPMLLARSFLGWLEGDLDALERHATQVLSPVDHASPRDLEALAHCFLGTCFYERNRLVEAERHLAILFDRRYTTKAIYAVHAGAALACTELALGRVDDADATVRALSEFVVHARSEFLQPVGDAFAAEFDLRRGRTTSGLRWARNTDLPTDQHRFMWFDTAPAQIEVLLASEPDAARGRELLAHALESAQRRHHRPLTIRLLGIHAIDLANQGNEPAALDTLETAVRLAHDGGIIRRLADLGPPLTPLLHRLDVTDDQLTHVGAILTAIEPPPREPSTTDPTVPTTPNAVAGEPALTAREADVLRLLADRYSNKEIARELLIAPATVKKHTVTLYDKLNVHGRREAVAKAHTLGYINIRPPPDHHRSLQPTHPR